MKVAGNCRKGISQSRPVRPKLISLLSSSGEDRLATSTSCVPLSDDGVLDVLTGKLVLREEDSCRGGFVACSLNTEKCDFTACCPEHCPAGTARRELWPLYGMKGE